MSDEMEFDRRVKFKGGKVDRVFTNKWSESGVINMKKLPQLLASFVEQRQSMIDYIDALHDKIDWILEKNHCCDISSCFRANCTSSHK